MTKRGVTAIRIVRGGSVCHVHGDRAGQEGIWLAQDEVDGLWEAPVKTTYKSGAFQVGSQYKAHKKLERRLKLGFHVRDTITSSYELNDSIFRQLFVYSDDPWEDDPIVTTIEVETGISGVRKLDVYLAEEPDFAPPNDPLGQQFGHLIVSLVAPQPMWYNDDIVSEFAGGTTFGSGTVAVANPTDQPMYQRWVVTPATWELPDHQWAGAPGYREPGGDNAERKISDIEITADNGGAVIDLDRSQLMWRDANDTNLQAQLGNTRFFLYEIPPYTPTTYLTVSYADAPAEGATVQLVQPYRWTRPWGLELSSFREPPPDLYTRFQVPGTFTYGWPDWADSVDYWLCGGGGGGGGGNLLLPGVGGAAGSWHAGTLVRGVDVESDVSVIVGVVGAGGAGGRLFADGNNGGASSITAEGMSEVSAAGGIGSGHGPHHISGEGADPFEWNGITMEGSQDTFDAIPALVGHSPGGGGAGGWPISRGGDGGRGIVVFRAFRAAGS